jgi:hypothetical protein
VAAEVARPALWAARGGDCRVEPTASGSACDPDRSSAQRDTVAALRDGAECRVGVENAAAGADQRDAVREPIERALERMQHFGGGHGPAPGSLRERRSPPFARNPRKSARAAV